MFILVSFVTYGRYLPEEPVELDTVTTYKRH